MLLATEAEFDIRPSSAVTLAATVMADHNATSIEDLRVEILFLKANFDQFFILINGVVVSLMQAGFALLEAGAVHTKNTANIIMKNLLDLFICAGAFYLFGYAFAYGKGSKYIGLTYFANSGLPDSDLAVWFFQFIFAATATTILSGAVAERCNFTSYIVYSPIISGVTYPIVAHWVWSEGGWLQTMGYKDFAGCGAVHAFSGVCSFVAAAILGPRRGRFLNGKPQPLPGHSLPLVGVGALLLVTGFLSFNGGTLSRISNPNDGEIVARSMCNTILAGTGGSIVALFIGRMGWAGSDSPWPFSFIVNATLAGMVSVCAGVDQYEFWACIALGAVGCLVYWVLHFVVLNLLKVDDPLDTFALHFGAGIWGVLAMPIFTKDGGIVYTMSSDSFKQLGYNIAGGLIITVWAGLTSAILFGMLKGMGILRVSDEDEITGLDEVKHGEISYPSEAWPWSTLMQPVSENGHTPTIKGREKLSRPDFDNLGFEMEKRFTVTT